MSGDGYSIKGSTGASLGFAFNSGRIAEETHLSLSEDKCSSIRTFFTPLEELLPSNGVYFLD